MKGQIAVTGATGFIGRHLVLRMQEEGYRLRCLVRPGGDASGLQGIGVDLVRGELADLDSLRHLVREVDVVVHLAGQVSVSQAIADPSSAFLSHAVGTLNVLEAVRQSGEPDCTIIYPSSDQVYGRLEGETAIETSPTLPVNPYGAAKLAAEHLCQAYTATYSIPFVILRGANVYGAGQPAEMLVASLVRQLLTSQGPVRVGDTGALRNFVHVEDFVNAIHLCVTHKDEASNQVFNVGAGAARVEDLIRFLLALGQKHLGREYQVTRDPALMRPSNSRGSCSVLDCSEVERLLGWKPRYSLERGLEETFLHYLRGGGQHVAANAG